MNEIKFRIFNKTLKKMIYSDNDGFKNENNITELSTFFNFIEFNSNLNEFSELIQFLNLKDKYKEKIYEGDIGIFKDWRPKEIIYLEKISGYGLKDTLLWLSESDALEMEIIGNIYENKDLLNERS